MQKSILFLTVTALFLVLGCASDSLTPTNTLEEQQISTGVLEGKVTIGPTCPVQRPGEDCEAAPEVYLAHHLAITTTGGQFVKDVSLDGKGNYHTELAAGNYLVQFTPNDIGIGGSEPFETSVTGGETTNLDIHIDTGIR